MTRSRPINLLAAAALIPLAAFTVAACGGSATATTAPAPPKTTITAPAPPKTTRSAPATVRVAKTGLGNILVDSHGLTLYLFKADRGTTSKCSGACATAWPPLRATGKPTAGSGANPSLVGSTARSDGKPQVTYNRHPVYLYAGDQKPGDTNGQAINGFGAGWFALSSRGTEISGHASNPSGGGY